MDTVEHELRELCCKPTSRCFKGISILTGIFCLTNLLMAAIIGPVIKAHDGTTETVGIPDAEEIARRLKIMTKSTLWIAACMLIFSFVSYFFFVKYRNVE